MLTKKGRENQAQCLIDSNCNGGGA